MNISIKKVKIFFKKNRLILSILVLAFLVRIPGIYFDFPGVRQIADESYHISYIVKAMSEQTLYPDVILQYPLFLTFLYFPLVVLKLIYLVLREGLLSVDEIKSFMIMEGMGQLIIVTRWLSVLFGSATVALVYAIVQLLNKHKSAAILASVAYSLSLVPVYISHWGKMHSIMVFFLLLSLYFILIYEKDGRHRYLYYSSLSASLAISVHYLGISAIIFPLAGVFFTRQGLKLKEYSRTLLLYTVPVLFFYLLNFRGVVWMLRENIFNYYAKSEGAGLYEVGLLERFYFVVRDTFFVEPVFLILGLLAFVFTFNKLIKDKFWRYILLGLAFNYLIMISIVAAPWFSRWLLPFISLMIILGASYVSKWTEKLKQKNLRPVIYTLLIFPALLISGKWLWLLNTNTQIEAAEWIRDNIPAEEIIYSFDYKIELPLSKDAARWQLEENKVNSAKLNYILNKDSKAQGYNLFYDFGKKRFASLGGEETSYILISYDNIYKREEILNDLNEYNTLELVKEFKPTNCDCLDKLGTGEVINNPHNFNRIFNLSKSGPYIEIYKL